MATTTNYLIQIANSVAAKLRAEGCTKTVTITPDNFRAQPIWARQELAGRIFRIRDDLNRLPGEDHLTYEQSINAIIGYSHEALGLIVARGELRTPAILGYRIMSYHTQLDDFERDWEAGMFSPAGTTTAKDLTKARALASELVKELSG